MRLAKGIFKICVYGASAVVLVLCLEAVYFYRVIQSEKPLEKADAIVVFDGYRERVEAGYKLSGLGYAPNLVVSPADAYHLKNYNLRYGLPESVNLIREEKARTTFENAYYTGKIIRDNRFDSIILVTSRYHLPRSLFLLKMVLLGQPVRIQIHSPSAGGGSLWTYSGGRRLIHREMLRFWGSLCEFVFSKAAGGVLDKSLKDYSLVKWVRSMFSI